MGHVDFNVNFTPLYYEAKVFIHKMLMYHSHDQIAPNGQTTGDKYSQFIHKTVSKFVYVRHAWTRENYNTIRTRHKHAILYRLNES